MIHSNDNFQQRKFHELYQRKCYPLSIISFYYYFHNMQYLRGSLGCKLMQLLLNVILQLYLIFIILLKQLNEME